MESKQLTIKNYFEKEEIQNKFKEMLGKRATQFITSVIQISNSNDLLKKSEPTSLINAAITAATLDLPINQNLGFAYIIPFNEKQKDTGSYVTKAQFQIGYKGFIQLAQRSGMFKTISATPIYEGQIISENPLTGFEFDFTVKSENIIGYAAYFELLNGFSKTMYMTTEQVKKHAVKYSQTFKKGFGIWKDDFESMAIKTVLKLLIAKYAPLSVEMQRAVLSDQSIINDTETMDVSYIDNTTQSIEEINDEKEKNRLIEFINNAKTVKELTESIGTDILEKYDLIDLYEFKLENLK